VVAAQILTLLVALAPLDGEYSQLSRRANGGGCEGVREGEEGCDQSTLCFWRAGQGKPALQID